MTNLRKYKAALTLVERDIVHLGKVRASLKKRVADHDVIDDYVAEREEDLAYQKKSLDEYLRDVEKKVSSSRTRKADLCPQAEDMYAEEEEEVEELEHAMDELEQNEHHAAKKSKAKTKKAEEEEDEEEDEEKKAGIKAKVAKVVQRVDAAAERLEHTNPKLAARLDMVSNTLEKKYGLVKK